MSNEHVEGLKARLAVLDQEREAILNLLKIWGENPPTGSPSFVVRKGSTQSFTTSGRIIDATIDLIHKLGRQAKNSEIMEYVKERQLTLGNTDNPDRMLAAILANEAKKKDGRIKSAARGFWDMSKQLKIPL